MKLPGREPPWLGTMLERTCLLAQTVAIPYNLAGSGRSCRNGIENRCVREEYAG